MVGHKGELLIKMDPPIIKPNNLEDNLEDVRSC